MKRRISLAILACLSVAGMAKAVDFNSETSISKSQQIADITVANTAGTFWFTLPANTIEPAHKVRVKLAKVNNSKFYSGTEQPISDVYRYTLLSSKPFKLSRTVSLKLAYPSIYANSRKVLKYYDKATQSWKRAKHLDDIASNLTFSGEVKKKHGIVALFEKPMVKENVIEGIASYYAGSGAACNDFPMGSRIRVTNIETGAYVDTTIVSTGPFVPGRVVDLATQDFAKIASLSAGLVRVTVQAIE